MFCAQGTNSQPCFLTVAFVLNVTSSSSSLSYDAEWLSNKWTHFLSWLWGGRRGQQSGRATAIPEFTGMGVNNSRLFSFYVDVH